MSEIARHLGRRHLYASVSVTAQFYNRQNGVDLKSRRGTGFVVRGESQIYFVTNRHVVDYNYVPPGTAEVNHAATLEKITVRAEFQPADLSEHTKWTRMEYTAPTCAFPQSDFIDLAAFVAFDPGRPAYLEQEIPSAEWQVNHYSTDWLATRAELNSVLPGDSVYIAGFPGLDQVVPERPLLVAGIVSSDPRYPATFGDEKLENSVLCHAFSWEGMSGAPVVGVPSMVSKARVLGVNAGHIASNGVAGGVISHFIRSDALIDLLVSMGEPISTD